MRVASVQFAATPLNPARNRATAERLARQAAGQGARLVVLPALFNTGSVYSDSLLRPGGAEEWGGPTLTWLSQLSAELDASLAGTLPLRLGPPPRVVNVFVVVEPGGPAHRYGQQHPLLWERCFFRAGSKPAVAQTRQGRIGLLVGRDFAFRQPLESYRGRADLLLVASALPRLHRAVLNFPLGRKVYLAQLMAALLRDRRALDRWVDDSIAARAAGLGVPIVHAAMAGRLATEIPFPRLCFALAALSRPDLWPLAVEAHRASLRATFYGGSSIVDGRGATLARVEAEEGIAVADIAPGPAAGRAAVPGDWPERRLPLQMRGMDLLLRAAARLRGR